MPAKRPTVNPKMLFKLDGGDLVKVAKRVKRSVATVRRWKREGIPAAAKAAVLKVVSRAKTPSRKVTPKARKPVTLIQQDSRLEARKARLAKAEKALAKERAAIARAEGQAARRENRAFTEVADYFDSQASATVVPLTAKERSEMGAQRELVAQYRALFQAKMMTRELERVYDSKGYTATQRWLRRRAAVDDNTAWWKTYQGFMAQALQSHQETYDQFFSPKAIHV